MRLPRIAAAAALGVASASVAGYSGGSASPVDGRAALPGLVTWDEHSILVRGERIFLFSGEFHPFRLPVPDLWLDVFQKIKSMGFTGVSFYVDWALLEGAPGSIVTDGIFSLKKMFDAAEEAGLYLLARPGPFINAEAYGGGYPGWIQRVSGALRSNAADYVNATKLYTKTIGEIIAKAQIPHGPVILFQPENEFGGDAGYMATVQQLFHDAGINVPTVVNDNSNSGRFRPGSGRGAVDIYGIDAYPMGFDCSRRDAWSGTGFPRAAKYPDDHKRYSPTTPFSIIEFQGGSFDPWGGVGMEYCADMINSDATKLLYKSLYAASIKILNLYMTYGGTNWGNLGHPGGYTSYDYGAAITEDRRITREKYHEQKLQANFFKVVPAYLTATPGSAGDGLYGAPKGINVSPLWATSATSNFYVVWHTDFRSRESTPYTLQISTSAGNLTVPQLGGALTLNGRDAKIHITDLAVGSINILYTTGEVYSIGKSGSAKVLLLYAGQDEVHEFAVPKSSAAPTVYGAGVNSTVKDNYIVVQWQSSPQRRVLRFGDALAVHLLDRNEAYKIWPVELPAQAPVSNYFSPSKDLAIVKAGYLVRNASINGSSLYLTGDINSTTEVEVIAVPSQVDQLFFNSKPVSLTKTEYGTLKGSVVFTPPPLPTVGLDKLDWKYIDSLPEIKASYDDTLWTACNQTTSNNPRKFTTPTSLYSADYGYHGGSLLYRGHFTASGKETTLAITTQGGSAYAHALWLNGTFLGSFAGSPRSESSSQTVDLPPDLTPGVSYVITVLLDHMGNNEGSKSPRGILAYTLAGHPAADVAWKVTGNLGEEGRRPDPARGPLNEGATFAQRAGYHQPGALAAPGAGWTSRSPLATGGLERAGVGFFAAEFELAVPAGWDVPMAIRFGSGTAAFSRPPASGRVSSSGNNNYRAVLFINGYQFGKMVANIGPQWEFPVPEGVLNHRGKNYIAVELWALDTGGARLDGLQLVQRAVIMSGYKQPELVPTPVWEQRAGVY